MSTYQVTIRIEVDDNAGYVHPSMWDWQALVDCADPVDVLEVTEVMSDPETGEDVEVTT